MGVSQGLSGCGIGAGKRLWGELGHGAYRCYLQKYGWTEETYLHRSGFGPHTVVTAPPPSIRN